MSLLFATLRLSLAQDQILLHTSQKSKKPQTLLLLALSKGPYERQPQVCWVG